MSLLVLSVAVLTLVDGVWPQMLNAAFLAFIIVQMSFTGHDLGHKQVFRSSRNNDILGLFVSFLIGINRTGGSRSITSTTVIPMIWTWILTLKSQWSRFRKTRLAA